MRQSYLLDKDFLKQLDLDSNKEVYARIILLNWEEMPKYEITGRITQGSINIDGSSAVRRTCSLTMLTEQGTIESNYWGLENKFKLAVGIKNNINSKYPDVCWFEQGLYIITSLSETQTASSHTISIQGKDKMCLLNGEFGGNFMANSTDIGQMEVDEREIVSPNVITYKKDLYYLKDEYGDYYKATGDFDASATYYGDEIYTETVYLTIENIIKNLLNAYGKELPQNIVIEDLQDYGLELLEYRGSKPLYLIKEVSSDVISNMTFDGTKTYFIDTGETETSEDGSITIIREEVSLSSTSKIIYDYLISQITTNPTYVYTEEDEDCKNPYTIVKLEYGDAAGYRKTELTYPGELVANLGETITGILDKIKNTFSTFEYFYDINGKFHFQKKRASNSISWNPLKTDAESGEIYSEATMYSSAVVYNFEGNNQFTNISYQPNIGNIKNDFSIWGKRTSASGTELPIHLRYAIQEKPTYYKSILDEHKEYNSSDYDWRELVYQMARDYYQRQHKDKDFLVHVAEFNPQYPNGITGYENFYIDMISFWREIYDPEGDDDNFDSETHFHKNVVEAPELLNFWFDFIDIDSEYGKYSVSRIGDRTQTENNDSICAVYMKDIPDILLLTNSEYEDLVADVVNFQALQGYTFIKIPDSYEQYFTISSQGLSAWDVFNDVLYENTIYNETITLTTFPIYYLEPNNRILVNVGEDKINGEYLLDKITVPLGHSGTGSITASKAVDRIY